MKLNRRGFFGLAAGAAAVPLVPTVEASAEPAVTQMAVVADDTGIEYLDANGAPKLLWPGINAWFGTYSGD